MNARYAGTLLICAGLVLCRDASAAQDAGETFERQLTASYLVGTNRVLDLDTGRVLSVPADRVGLNNPRPFFNWLVETGGDLTVDMEPSGNVRFRVDDGRILQITNSMGSVTWHVLEQRLEKEGSFQALQLPLAEAQAGAVLAFRTREGSIGVMQLAACTREPAVATVRYKLLKATPKSR